MNIRNMSSYARAVMGIMHGRRAFGGPLQANVFLTNRCNLRCIHCLYYSPFVERPNTFETRMARTISAEPPAPEYLADFQRLDADIEGTKNLIDSLINMGTKRYIFSGVGEPFLHKNTLEFMGRIKHAGGAGTVFTNGTLLNAGLIDELLKMQFDELRITTLAGSNEVYMKTHAGVGQNTFHNLRDCLIYLSERKAGLGMKKPEVTLIFVVIPQNHEDVFRFADFAKAVKADRVMFNPVITAGDPDLEKTLVLTSEQSAALRENLSEVKPFLESHRIVHNIEYFLKSFRSVLDTSSVYRIIPCYMGWLSVMVDVRGLIYPCCQCYEPLGNVREVSFKNIWNSQEYSRFRKETIKIYKRSEPIKGCECNCCPHFIANLRVFKMLHPIRGRSESLKHSYPDQEI